MGGAKIPPSMIDNLEGALEDSADTGEVFAIEGKSSAGRPFVFYVAAGHQAVEKMHERWEADRA